MDQDPPLQLYIMDRHKILDGLKEAKEYIEKLEHDLAACYRLSGADPDGNEDWRLAPRAVGEIRRLIDESYEQRAEDKREWGRTFKLLSKCAHVNNSAPTNGGP